MMLIIYIALGIVLGLFIWHNLDALLGISWVLIKFSAVLIAIILGIFLLYQVVTSFTSVKIASTPPVKSSNKISAVNEHEVPPQIEAFIKSVFKNEKNNFDLSTTDINLDGKPDYIFEIKDGIYCGTSGCDSAILISNKNNGFDVAFHQNSQKIVVGDEINGVRTIQFSHHKCACDCNSEKLTCLITQSWDGKKLNLISKRMID